jgi:hypothetical protein
MNEIDKIILCSFTIKFEVKKKSEVDRQIFLSKDSGDKWLTEPISVTRCYNMLFIIGQWSWPRNKDRSRCQAFSQ